MDFLEAAARRAADAAAEGAAEARAARAARAAASVEAGRRLASGFATCRANVIALTHGWRMDGKPDPDGKELDIKASSVEQVA